MSGLDIMLRDYALWQPTGEHFALVFPELLSSRDEALELRRIFKEGGLHVILTTDLSESPELRVPLLLESDEVRAIGFDTNRAALSLRRGYRDTVQVHLRECIHCPT